MDKWEELSLENVPEVPSLQGKEISLENAPKSMLEEDESKETTYTRVVGIRFSEMGPVFDFDAQDDNFAINDAVVAEMPERGIMLGYVSKPPIPINDQQIRLRLPKIIRKASEDDIETDQKVKKREVEAKLIAQSAVSKADLKMEVLRVRYTLDLRKATVFFMANQRVDFRELLKDLIHDLKARVELRQIGARDNTRQIGGIGPCGEELCCARHIKKFHSVMIKMAKNQEISLKPSRVTGMCGRLKCCLAYENKAYQEEKKNLPCRGTCVLSREDGHCGVIKDMNIIKHEATVLFEDGTVKMLPVNELLEQKGKKRNVPDRKDAVITVSDIDTGESEDESTLKNLED